MQAFFPSPAEAHLQYGGMFVANLDGDVVTMQARSRPSRKKLSQIQQFADSIDLRGLRVGQICPTFVADNSPSLRTSK